jgi:hypothetical protein
MLGCSRDSNTKARSFEGIVEWGLGISGDREFRVMTMTNPFRLVVDVKHE